MEQATLSELDHLYGCALSLVRHKSDAEDLVQEICLKALRTWQGFKAGTHFRAWVFTILRNTFYSDWRRKKNIPDIKPLDDDSNFSFYAGAWKNAAGIPGMVQASGVIDSTKLLELVEDEIVHALESLPPEFREAIFLCDVEALSYAEIAKILNIPIGTVRSRLARARGTLEKLLWDYAQKKGYFKVPS